MPKREPIIEKGKIFILSDGVYSDYQVYTVCRAREELDIRGLMDEFKAQVEDDYHYRGYKFVSWLICEKRLAEELDYQEWYLGRYGFNDGGAELKEPDTWWR